MQLCDDIQDALACWQTDATQWLLTDHLRHAVCTEVEAHQLLRAHGWRLTSPEEIERHLAQA